MNDRARHEASIERLDSKFGGEFDKALHRVIMDHAFSRGRFLAFFTDEQIAEIRADMVRMEWKSHQFRKYQRDQIAAIRAMCETEAG